MHIFQLNSDTPYSSSKSTVIHSHTEHQLQLQLSAHNQERSSERDWALVLPVMVRSRCFLAMAWCLRAVFRWFAALFHNHSGHSRVSQVCQEVKKTIKMSAIHLHCLLLSQSWKPIFSHLHTVLFPSAYRSVIFFSLYQSTASNACISVVCVCVTGGGGGVEREKGGVGGETERESVCVCVCVCVCDMKWVYPYVSVSILHS